MVQKVSLGVVLTGLPAPTLPTPITLMGLSVTEKGEITGNADIILRESYFAGGLVLNQAANLRLWNVVSRPVVFVPTTPDQKLRVQGYLHILPTTSTGCFQVQYPLNTNLGTSTCASQFCGVNDVTNFIGQGARDPVPKGLSLKLSAVGAVFLRWTSPCSSQNGMPFGFVIRRDAVVLEQSKQTEYTDVGASDEPGIEWMYCVESFLSNDQGSTTAVFDAFKSVSLSSNRACLPFVVPFMATIMGKVVTREFEGQRAGVPGVKVCALPTNTKTAYQTANIPSTSLRRDGRTWRLLL